MDIFALPADEAAELYDQVMDILEAGAVKRRPGLAQALMTLAADLEDRLNEIDRLTAERDRLRADADSGVAWSVLKGLTPLRLCVLEVARSMPGASLTEIEKAMHEKHPLGPGEVIRALNYLDRKGLVGRDNGKFTVLHADTVDAYFKEKAEQADENEAGK